MKEALRLNPGLTDREIAQHVGVAPNTIRTARRAVGENCLTAPARRQGKARKAVAENSATARRTGKDGKSYAATKLTEIARSIGVSDMTVGRARKAVATNVATELARRTGKDGKAHKAVGPSEPTQPARRQKSCCNKCCPWRRADRTDARPGRRVAASWLGLVCALLGTIGPVEVRDRPALAWAMPDLNLSRLAVELEDTRRGIGPRRRELRQHLATIDPLLRSTRNLERLRLADLKMRLRTLDTRADSAPVQSAIEASAKRLGELDLRILQEIARRLAR